MMEIGTTLIITAGVLTIILAPLFAFVGSCVADAKGRSKASWLFLCGLFFPMLILLFLLPRYANRGVPLATLRESWLC
jgi:preprotein translocase subunit SecY